MQQRLRHPPLNAVRAFVSAARLGSLKSAAAELGVTANAISRHVKQLEEEVGKPLFIRRNNSIELTRDGKDFYDQVGPALKAIARASESVRKQAGSVVASVSTSLAHCWLIPRLPDFKRRYPRISIDLETERRPVVLTETHDIAISFSRHGAPTADAIHLLNDETVPMASVAFLREHGATPRITRVPLITSTPDGWEWKQWSTANAVKLADLNLAYRFDTDAAAFAAFAAGLGVMLVPHWLRPPDVAPASLQLYGRWKPVSFGDYWISIAPRARPAARTFAKWLLGQAKGTGPVNDNAKSEEKVRKRR
jgi:LysR family glycine cleavage system transcriptional activator